VRAEVVIARYREALDWAVGLPYPVVIYNHMPPEEDCPLLDGGKGPLPDNWTRIGLAPNIGREAHCYLTHILGRWESLADRTAFLQGDALAGPHIIGVGEIGAALKGAEPVRVLGDALACGADGGGGIKDMDGAAMDLAAAHELILGAPFPGTVKFPVGAQMVVSRDAILARPREVYERALGYVKTEPTAAWVLERLWLEIFKTEGAE